ncbi:MAG: aa3-type cytochrome c oxidase subunit IV [Hyphomicrobiaceae bacterium]
MSIDTSAGHKDMDYREHIRTYDGFILMTKVLIATVVAILIGMAVFLVH